MKEVTGSVVITHIKSYKKETESRSCDCKNEMFIYYIFYAAFKIAFFCLHVHISVNNEHTSTIISPLLPLLPEAGDRPLTAI